MSSIIFDISGNTDKYEKSLKDAVKTTDEFSKKVEQSGNKADRSFDKMGMSLKESVQKQKSLIKSLESEISKLEKAYKEMAAGQEKSNIGVDLRSARSSLSLQNEKLLDLQRQQIEGNTKEAASVKGLTDNIKDWALKLGGIAAAYKLVKEAIMNTTIGINAFNIAAATSNQIMYNIITNQQSWTAGIKNAIEVQKELNKVRFEDKIYERAALKEQIEYDKNIQKAHDQTLEGTERIQAYDQALVHLTNVNKLRKKAIQDEIDAQRKLLESQGGNEKATLRIMELENKLLQLDHRKESGLKEVASMRSGLIKKQQDDAEKLVKDGEKAVEDAKKKAIEDAKLSNQLKKQQELLAKAIEERSDKEVKAISRRIVKLEEELALRKKLTEQAIGAAIIRETPISRVSELKIPELLPSGLNISSTLAGKQTDKEVSKYIPGTTMLTKKALEEVAESKRKFNEEQEEALQRQLDLRKEITYEALNLIGYLGEVLGLDEDATKELQSGLSIFEGLATGNYLQAVAGVGKLLIDIFSQMGQKIDWTEKKLLQIDALIAHAQQLVDQSLGIGGTQTALEEELRLWEQKIDEINATAAKAWTLPGMPDKYLYTDEQAAQISAALEGIEKVKQALQDLKTGGIIPNTIADVIAQGFKDGKSSVDDFAGYMENMLRDSLFQVFKEQQLLPLINTWLTPVINKVFDDGVITPLEKEDILRATEMVTNLSKPYVDAINSIFPSETTNVGLSGQIQKSITEETGTELAGLFRRFADDQRIAKDYSILGVTHLIGIEKNTYDTVNELKNAVIELQAINTNTKQDVTAGLS